MRLGRNRNRITARRASEGGKRRKGVERERERSLGFLFSSLYCGVFSFSLSFRASAYRGRLPLRGIRLKDRAGERKYLVFCQCNRHKITKRHSMAQQNQETPPVDPANLPLKRKRGRPRKYDYDNPSNEQPRSIGLQTISSQGYPTTSSGHGIQAIQTQVNLASCSSLRLQSLPVQTNTTSCPIYGAHSLMVEADSTVNSSFGTQAAMAPTNPSACLTYGPKTVPAQAYPTANSAHLSQITPAQINSTATLSYASNDLVGQAVCGTLDGTLDIGYLLTVRVANTGDVLKGLVFDPRLCMPVSAENDIAPLLPMETPNRTSSSVVEAHSQTLVSVPIRPVPMSFAVALPAVHIKEPAATSDTGNHLLATSRVPHTALINTNKVAPNDTYPQLSTDKAARKDADSGPLDVPNALQAETQAKTLQFFSESSDDSANQESRPAAPQHAVVNDTQADDSLSPSAVDKASQMTLDVPSGDQSSNVIEPLGGEQSMHQVEESLAKASRENEEMHQSEKSSGNTVEVLAGDQGQHCHEESLQGKVQQLTDQTSDKGELCGEPKSDIGEQNLPAPSVP